MSDQEKIREQLKRLYKQYHDTDRKFEKAKLMRTLITVLVFSVFYFIILMIICGETDVIEMLKTAASCGIWEIVGMVLIPIIFAWIHFFANLTIFDHLIRKGKSETATLEHIKEQIRELEKTLK